MTTPATTATSPAAAPAPDYQANISNLTASLVASMGLPLGSDGKPDYANWTYDQRIAFNRAFATEVLKNPGNFPADRVASARTIIGEHPTALDDTSLSADLKTFGVELGNQALAAGEQVAGIGKGVLNLASAATWIIPLAGIAAIVILLLGLKKRVA